MEELASASNAVLPRDLLLGLFFEKSHFYLKNVTCKEEINGLIDKQRATFWQR